MKLSFAPLAIVAAVGFATTTAHAAISTTIGTAPPDLTGLYISIWDTQTKHSELVNLSNEFADLTTNGLWTPNSAGGLFVQKSNPIGSGNVLQLDFGVLPGFASTFGTPGANTDYMLVSTDNNTGVVYTYNGTPPLTPSSLPNAQTGVSGQIANWVADTTVNTLGQAIDLTGTAGFNALVGPNQGGTLGLPGFNFSQTVGTAVNFWQSLKGARGQPLNTTEYANSTGVGFWLLSASGDLTWNVPTGGIAPVPVPAAVWLFMSGLAGLGAIGRRRVAA